MEEVLGRGDRLVHSKPVKRKDTYMKKIMPLILLCLFAGLAGCSKDTDAADQKPGQEDLSEPAEKENSKCSEALPDNKNEDALSEAAGGSGGEKKYTEEAYWIAYWDEEEYLAKLDERKYAADMICIFEAYFDDDHRLVFPDNARMQYESIKKSEGGKEKKYYLTFVNDLVGEGGSSQKDTELLYDILKDPAGHARDITALAKAEGFDGVEIDYEKIRNDLGLWELFISFENELIKLCESEGLGLRIVLEPSTPTGQISLPKGPEYVVMCYNLYGYGTEPGPKADAAFLEKTVSDFEGLSDNLGYAFANGGFDWDLSKNEIKALTDLEGKELIKEMGAVPERDEKSGVLTFTYEKDGSKHEVWTADDETIRIWCDVIYEKTQKPVRLSLWRI